MWNKILNRLSILLLIAGFVLAAYLLPGIQREAARNASISSRGVVASVVAVEVSEATAEGGYAAFWADVSGGRVSVLLERPLTQDQILGKHFGILYDPVNMVGVESRGQLSGWGQLLIGKGWPFLTCIALSLVILAGTRVLPSRPRGLGDRNP